MPEPEWSELNHRAQLTLSRDEYAAWLERDDIKTIRAKAIPPKSDILLTPDGYAITEKDLHDSAVTLVFTPEGNAHVYVQTGLSPADVLELVLGFAHHTVSQHFGTYSPDKVAGQLGPTVIEG